MTEKKEHEKDIDSCSRIFVSWAWAAGILIGSALTISGLAWAGASKLTSVEMSIQNLQSDVDNLKAMDKKLDILLKRTEE